MPRSPVPLTNSLVADRFAFTARAQPLRVGTPEPLVHGYVWRHPRPAAVLVLVHGLQSHAQWFAEAAEALVDRGLAVYAVDRRGSGSSPALRGDVASYTNWYGELDRVVRLAQTEHPGVPVHLVGHCFGANVALGYALMAGTGAGSSAGTTVRSIVMLTPGLYVRPDYTPAQKLHILASGRWAPFTRFPVPQRDELFSRDPDVLAWIASDTGGARTLTARCLLEINRMVRRLRRDVGQLDVPVLVLEAARDRLAHNARNRALLTRALGDRCRWQTFDAEHFLLAEPCRDRVVETLVEWTTQRKDIETC
jgi:acylglycerol lipase